MESVPPINRFRPAWPLIYGWENIINGGFSSLQAMASQLKATYEKCWCSIAMLLYRRFFCLVMFPGVFFCGCRTSPRNLVGVCNTSNGMTEMAAGTGSGTSKGQRNYAKAIYSNRCLRSIWQRFDKESYQSILSNHPVNMLHVNLATVLW